MGISEESLHSEPSYKTLHNKHRGELAELAFMRKVANRGYAVSKPWGECERYDFVVRVGKLFWRVQVKSVRAKHPQRPHYCLKTADSHKTPYSPDDIDFLVAYIFPEDAWYVFPATVVENRKALHINPNSKRSHLEQFREAWKLMEQTGTGPTGMGQTGMGQPGMGQPGMGQPGTDQTCPSLETLTCKGGPPGPPDS